MNGPKKYIVYLLLGSNLPIEIYENNSRVIVQPSDILRFVREEIAVRFEIIDTSDLMETRPFGLFDDEGTNKVGNFFNQIVVVRTDFSPIKCLDVFQSLELKWGRIRDKQKLKNGENKKIEKIYKSRSIDIDILSVFRLNDKSPYLKEVKRNTPRLQLPHPQIESRPFVRELLSQLTPIENINL